jgi:hypothetical protein
VERSEGKFLDVENGDAHGSEPLQELWQFLSRNARAEEQEVLVDGAGYDVLHETDNWLFLLFEGNLPLAFLNSTAKPEL